MEGDKPTAPGAADPLGDRLDSWKEIAAYLGRGIRTVQRWEREEGLPVHRLAHEKRGSIYARRAELAAWWESRRVTLARTADEPAPPARPRFERVTSTTAMTSWPALSPDGRFVAYVSDGGHDGTTPQVWVQQIGGAALRVTNGDREHLHVSFSPESTNVLFTVTGDSGPSIYEVPALGGDPRLVQRDASRGTISPDGRWLASVPRDRAGVRVGARGSAGFRSVAPELVDVACAVWTPDSRVVLIHARHGPSVEPDWWLVPLDGGAPVNTGIARRLQEIGMFAIPTGAAWLGDSLVLSVAGPRGICLYRQPVALPDCRPADAVEPLTAGNDAAWLPSAAGDRLVFISSNADGNLWSLSLDADRVTAHGPLRRLTRGPMPLGYLTVTSDFRTLVYFSYRLGPGTIFVRDLLTGTERALNEAPPGEKGYPAISPGGSVLAFGLKVPRGAQARRPIVIGRPGDTSWRSLGEDSGGRPREWVDERRLIIERFARLNSIGVIDTATSVQQDLLVSGDRSISNPRLSPDRRWIAFDASGPSQRPDVCVAPFRDAPLPEATWITVHRSASHPFWSADGRCLYCMPAGTNALIRSVIAAWSFDPDTGLRDEKPTIVYTPTEMTMPAYLPGTAPIATPDQIILVLGDFRGDVWLMDLGAGDGRGNT